MHYSIRLTIILSTALLCICQKADNNSAAQSNSTPTPWPIYRGTSSLHGVARGNISDSLGIAWTFKTGDAVLSSPVTDGKTVFVGSLDEHLYALELSSGKELWRFKAGDEIEASPMIRDSTVFIGDLDGTMYALDTRTGVIRWSYKTGNKIVGSANYVEEKDCVVFGSHDDTLYCLSANEGEAVWKYGSGSYINGTPATDGKVVVFGGCDESVHVVDVNTGTKVGQVITGSYIAGSVVLREEYAWVGNYGKKFFGINLKENRIQWEYENSGKQEPFFAGPAIIDTLVIATSRDGFVHCISSFTGRLIWKYATNGPIDGSPVICGDKVIIGSDDGLLHIIDLKNGSPLQSYDVGGAILGSPMVSGPYIVVGDENGMVNAFTGI